MKPTTSFLYPVELTIATNNVDPTGSIIGFSEVQNTLPYVYSPHGHNQPPDLVVGEDNGPMVWNVKHVPSGILRSFGATTGTSGYNSARSWIGDRNHGTDGDNAYLLVLDWLLSTSSWTTDEFNGFFSPSIRDELIPGLLEEGALAYFTSLRDNHGTCPDGSFILGVIVHLHTGKYRLRIILPDYFLTAYPHLTRAALAAFLGFYGSGGTTSRDLANGQLIVDPESTRDDSGEPADDGDMVGDVPLTPTTGRTPRHRTVNTLSLALRSTSPDKGVARFKQHIAEEIARTSAAPVLLDHHAEAFIPQYASNTLAHIERLRSAEEISNDLAELLEGMAQQQANTINYTSAAGTMRAKSTVKFDSHPAAQSQPGVSETGINDYQRAQDTRRYGFDMGFLAEVLKGEFLVKKSNSHRPPNLLTFLMKVSKNITNKTLMRSKESLRRKHHFLFSLAHKMDRMDRCAKYIEAWVTAVGINPNDDQFDMDNMMAIIPKSWYSNAERECLARRHPTMNRDQFKKDIAAKLQLNFRQLLEEEKAQIVSLSAELLYAEAKLSRDFFKIMFEELNSLPDNMEMAIEFYKDAENMISSYTLTNDTHDIFYLDDTEVESGHSRDVLATKTTTKIVSKLRDMSTSAKIQVQALGVNTLGLAEQLKIVRQIIPMGTMRFSPSGQQPWLSSGNQRIAPLSTDFSEVKMRGESVLPARVWSIILFAFTRFQDQYADLQSTFSEEWERTYLAKALKEDEKRQAAYIFADVQVMLGHRETICTFHRLREGANHKNIHCMYMPCYLHAWKCYEVSDPDESDIVVSLKPGAKVHFNGECKLQQRFAKQLQESRHTYLYHDADLNVVSQDGKVFEPAVYTTRATQDAVPGRNSRARTPTTFRRPRATSGTNSLTSNSSHGSNRTYLTNKQLNKQMKYRKRGSSQSRGSSKTSRSSSRSQSTYRSGSTIRSQSTFRTNRTRGGTKTKSRSKSRTGRKTSSRGSSVRSGSTYYSVGQNKNSNNRYSKDWTSRQISQAAARRRPPSPSSVTSHELRPRSQLRKPAKLRSGSITSSGKKRSPT